MRRATGAAAERVSSRTGSTGGSRSNFRIIQTGGTPFGAFPLFIFQYRRLSSAHRSVSDRRFPIRTTGTFFRNHTRRSFSQITRAQRSGDIPGGVRPSIGAPRPPDAASRIFASALSPPCRLPTWRRAASDRRNSRCPGTRCGIFRPPPRPCPHRISSSSTHPSCI